MAKSIIQRIFPVDQPDSLGVLACIRLHLHAVAQQAIDRFIDVVEALGLVTGHLVEFVQGAVDEGIAVALSFQEGTQIVFFDVADCSRVLSSRLDNHSADISWSNLTTRRWVFFSIWPTVLIQANPPGQEFLHHSLLESSGFIAAGFQAAISASMSERTAGDSGLFGFFLR